MIETPVDRILLFNLMAKDEFHLLRHFVKVPDDYLLRLAESLGLRRPELETQIKLAGSKFDNAFAETPDELWEKLKEVIENPAQVKIERRGRDDYHLSFNFSREEYPQGVGTNGVIKIADIPSAERKTIKTVFREGSFSCGINTLSKKPLPPTWEIHAILKVSVNSIKIYTIFPGTYAPPLPRSDRHTPEEIEKFRLFWQTHALIE